MILPFSLIMCFNLCYHIIPENYKLLVTLIARDYYFIGLVKED
ncbi:hypothetical protein DOT_2825 [Desulfosporosinus sp. OT]|nr:hypothetical protein DOT_2825 [Desulfosporosinus sp. OT]